MLTDVEIDAPAGALTPALREAVRAHKHELLDVVEEIEERAAIAQYCGGLSRPEAEELAWGSIPMTAGERR